MKRTLETIGFEEVRRTLIELARTPQAKEKIVNMTYYATEEELNQHLEDTTKARHMLDIVGNPPIPSIDIVEKLLDRFNSGALVEPEELQLMGDFLRGVRQLIEYLTKDTENGLSDYRESFVYPEEVYEEIDRCIRSGKIVDEASSKLAKLRKKLKKIKPELKNKAQATLNSNRKYMSEDFVVSRDGRWCVPVKKEHQHRIPGTAMTKSSTGSTVFIEPASVTKLQEEYYEIKMAQYQEEAVIITALMEAVLAYHTPILKNIEIIITLDFIFAKGKLSQQMGGTEPSINHNRSIHIQHGRHPSLNPEIAVPLDFSIGGEIQGVVVTGPNTGGKTVSIKTVAIISVMANLGLHVPAQMADVGFHIDVLCDIGDGQSIENNLSTFSAHITNVMEIINTLNENTLVVLDELGSGTDPTEGVGIAIAILEELRIRGCLFLVTTHYSEVKVYASRHKEIMNARMAFDRENLQPRYKLEQGKAGESCALYIAKRLGVPARMLAMAAKEAYGQLLPEIREELGL